MTINHSNRKISALLFYALLTTNMPLFCPAGQNDDEVELSDQNDVETALIPKEENNSEKVTNTIEKGITATASTVQTSISNSTTRRIAKTIGCGFLALLAFTAGGFATYEYMQQSPATLNLNPVDPCTIDIELNPHDLPHCYGVHTDNSERALLIQKERQDLLLATAMCKADEVDDCADVCSSHHKDYTFELKKIFNAQKFHKDFDENFEDAYVFLIYHPCPKHVAKESNFALCPVKLADIEEYHESSTPLQTVRQRTNITSTSDCPFANRIGSGDKIGVTYPEVRPEKGKLPHQRHKFKKTIVDTCERLQQQIRKSERQTGCSVVIHE